MTQKEHCIEQVTNIKNEMLEKGFDKNFTEIFCNGVFSGIHYVYNIHVWHKHPDEKPQTQGYYLIYDTNGDMLCTNWYPEEGWYYPETKIVAWMELPKAPNFVQH